MIKFIIYICIGGVVLGLCDKSRVEKCNKHLSSIDSGFIILLYPALIISAQITNSTGEDICAN